MAAAGQASTDDDGFTMNFTLDVVRDISKDVEDVARQGALGNFRNARSMYEEALEAHRDQFPIYAEYLRLCLESGDWGSLAEVSDYGAGRWSYLAVGIVKLLHAVGTVLMNDYERAANKDLVRRPYSQLEGELTGKEFSTLDNEEVSRLKHRFFRAPANAEIDACCCDYVPVDAQLAWIKTIVSRGNFLSC
jgi:hypothetical protein